MSKSRRVAFCAVFSALAIIFSYIETLFNFSSAIPGVKPGISNIAIIVSLFILGKKEAFFVMLIKVLVSSLLFHSPTVLIYSLFGGVFSFFVMCLLMRFGFHIITISLAGGLFHNTGQLLCASLFMKNFGIFYYLPVLLLAGSLFGVLTGILSLLIIKRLKNFK